MHGAIQRARLYPEGCVLSVISIRRYRTREIRPLRGAARRFAPLARRNATSLLRHIPTASVKHATRYKARTRLMRVREYCAPRARINNLHEIL